MSVTMKERRRVEDDKKCKWCKSSFYTGGGGVLGCEIEGLYVDEDGWCDLFERIPGADDDKGE